MRDDDDKIDEKMPPVQRLIRTIYCMERRKFVLERTGIDSNRGLDDRRDSAWDGGPNARGTNKKSIWPKLTAFILENKLDPVLFIQLVFEASVGNKPPGPDMFINNRVLELYRGHADLLINKVNIYFEHCLREFRFRWELKKETNQANDISFRLIVHGPDLNVSAMYRYCLTLLLNRVDISKEFYDAALQDYILNEKAFETVLGKFLSDGFRQDAQQLRGKAVVEI